MSIVAPQIRPGANIVCICISMHHLIMLLIGVCSAVLLAAVLLLACCY